MISIQNHQDQHPHLPRSLRRRIHKIVAALGLEGVEISTLLCDDARIQELNLQWRDIDKATDVLSFPQEEFEQPMPLSLAQPIDLDQWLMIPVLGDIALSVETCARQAVEWEHTMLDEATRLWVHGLLHLCGYDHQEPEQAEAMLQKEEEILQIFSRNAITPLVSL